MGLGGFKRTKSANSFEHQTLAIKAFDVCFMVLMKRY